VSARTVYFGAFVSLTAALALMSQGVTADAGPPRTTPVVSQLPTNNLIDPVGVSGETPRLSWQLNASRRGVSQQRYEVHVASTAAGVGEPDVWNSGVVSSARSVDVPYAGPALVAYKWIGADTSTGAEWTDYTVALDFTLKKDAFGVFFRGRAGLGYMWQINEETAGTPLFRPHVRNDDGGYSVLAEIPLAVDLRQRHSLKITVAGRRSPPGWTGRRSTSGTGRTTTGQVSSGSEPPARRTRSSTAST
jgi:alpha-L-rhamnosidase